MKLISLMPVKNEDWIIDRSIEALSQFCDVIIVADEGSTDSTLEILRRFPKVLVVENTERFLNHNVRTLLLNTARDFDGNNLIFNLDADEIPAATILKHENLQKLIDIPIGSSAVLNWIQLWKSPIYYRNDDSVWSNSRKHFVFRDDRESGYETKDFAIDHAPKVPTKTLSNSIIIDDIPILHYQFVLFDRMLAKQRLYRIIESLTTKRTPEIINATYIITRDEMNMRLNPVPDAWLNGWKELGIDLVTFHPKDLYWYEREVLKIFAEHGIEKFAKLDIWDVDWENKRQAAILQGYKELPQTHLRDPRNLEQKAYHAYLHKYFRTPTWNELNLPLDIFKQFIRKMGLRREHFEKIGVLTKRDSQSENKNMNDEN